MVSPVTGISLSGLSNSSTRLANSANNVANQFSTLSRVNGETVKKPFEPQVVSNSSLASGGVRTHLLPKDPAVIQLFDPDNAAAGEDGVTDFPNVDTANEIVNQMIAQRSFEANLKPLIADDENTKALLDTIG